MTAAAPLAAALEYAQRGWAVFPCHSPQREGRCSCRRVDCARVAKHPRTRRGLLEATTEPAAIRSWWRRWPDANVGVRTGSVSGVVVLDVDVTTGGVAALRTLELHYGRLRGGTAARTGGGGRHYWFAHPGEAVPNSTGRLAPGLDVRADGGYVIVPPSLHRSGDRYTWVWREPPLPMPGWLLARCREPERPIRTGPSAPPLSSPVVGPWAQAALQGELTRMGQAPTGRRNHTLNRAAFVLGQLVGAGHLDAELTRDALINAGMSSGLTRRETTATVASGLRAGQRFPRSPEPR